MLPARWFNEFKQVLVFALCFASPVCVAAEGSARLMWCPVAKRSAPQANPNAVHGEICLRPKWSPSLIEVRLMHAELALTHSWSVYTDHDTDRDTDRCKNCTDHTDPGRG